MKRFFCKILLVCLTACLFAAARPSLDGRAVVADRGDMPEGLFAKTVGYLPGDSVSVTNPTSGITIEILVLGAIDPSEGVAILLSPEAAEKLGIQKNSNIQVKITKRTGQLDVAVKGTAVLAHSDGSIDELPPEDTAKSLAVATEAPIADSTVPTEKYEETSTDFSTEKEQLEKNSPIEETEAKEESGAAPFEAISPEEADFGNKSYIVEDENKIAKADNIVTIEPVAAEPVESEPVATEPVESEPVAADPVETEELPSEVQDSPEPVENIDTPLEEKIESEPVEAEELPDEQTVGEQVESEALPASSEKVEKAEIPVADAKESSEQIEAEELPPVEEQSTEAAEEPPAEVSAPIIAPEEDVSEKIEEDIPQFTEPVENEVPEVEEENPDEPEADLTIPSEAVSKEVVPEEKLAPVENAVPEEEPAPVETETVPIEEEVVTDDSALLTPVETEEIKVEEQKENIESNEYNPIILVPTESVAPSTDEQIVEEPEVEPVENNVTSTEVTSIKESTPKESVVAKTQETQTAVSNKIEQHKVSSTNEMKKGSDVYYIQIAVLTNEDNINCLLDKYGKYPIILLSREGGSGYKVLVGPLNKDEYGSVLEKFKAFGFKDAFLKKIK